MNHTQAKQLEQGRQAREYQKPADLEHWQEIGKRIEDPATAELVVNFMDQHPALKARLGGLYVRAQETLRQKRLALARAAAEEMNREQAARRQFFQHIGSRARRAGDLAYRSVRLVFRGARDLLFLIQDAGTVRHGHPALTKRAVPQGKRA